MQASASCGAPNELVLQGSDQTTVIVSRDHLFALRPAKEPSYVAIVWARSAGDPVVVDEIEGAEQVAVYLPSDAYCPQKAFYSGTDTEGVRMWTTASRQLQECVFPQLSPPCAIACDGTFWNLARD